MSNIYNLLNINSEILHDFSLQALRVDENQIEKIINKNTRKLKMIEERMFVSKGIKVSQQSIEDVIKKVRKFADKEDISIDNWSIRELRIISYYLMKLRNNHKHYYFALSLLESGWRNMFLNGLVFYIMSSWNYIEMELREATSNLIITKLKEYKDKNKRYLLLKNHSNFFDKSGPRRMAALLTAKKIGLIDAPKIIGFKESAFKQSYYSDVIINYIESNNISDLDKIEELFEIHDIDRTKKLVCASLVEKANKNSDDIGRSILCRFINRTLGDVTLTSTWAPFAGASSEEAKRLKKAMKLVYMWFAQQIIEVFFDICVQDKDRKRFWLKYVHNLSGFKLVGSVATKRLLQGDSRIGSMFLKHFIETNSYKSQTSALVLFIKNKMLVEFSDTGALYVYNQEHSQVKLVTSRRYLNSTNDLKIPSIQLLVESDYYYTHHNEEGRFHHRGDWQNRLTYWLNNKVLNNSNNHTSFFETKDDDIFKETPLTDKDDFYLDDTEEDSNTSSAENNQIENNSATDDDILYEQNLRYRISSKIFNSRYRVVASEKGFYINQLGHSTYAKIKNLNPGEKPSGDIWIKNYSNDNWFEVIHFYFGATINVGYIKFENPYILFKEAMNKDSYKEIKL